MVPSRSRKTAGRRDAASARGPLRGAEPATHGGFHRFRPHTCHTTVVGGATPQKTWTAIWLFLYHGAPRSDRGGTVRIRRTKDRDHWQADRGGNMHCAGIVAGKQLAPREERGEIGNRSLAHQTNRGAFYSGGDRVGNLVFAGSSEKNDVRVRVEAEAVDEIGEALWRPALRGAVRGPGPYGNSQHTTASACRRQGFFRMAAVLFRNVKRYKGFTRQRVDPAGAAQKL